MTASGTAAHARSGRSGEPSVPEQCLKRLACRYFFDKITGKCIKFGGCAAGQSTNNFASQSECEAECGPRGRGGTATLLVEVILTLGLAGLAGLAAYLGWRRHRLAAGPSFRRFQEEDEGGRVGDVVGTGTEYSNPAFLGCGGRADPGLQRGEESSA